MTTEAIILHICDYVDDRVKGETKMPQNERRGQEQVRHAMKLL